MFTKHGLCIMTPRCAKVLLGFAVLIAACASGGSTVEQGSYQQSHVILDAPGGRYDLLLTRDGYMSSDTLVVPPKTAWGALVQTYAGFGVPLQGMDPAARMVATQYFHAHAAFAGERMSRWLECGSTLTGDNASNYEITMRFGSLIDTSVVGRSIVRTVLTATAVAPGTGTNTIECMSRGNLEKQIARLVASKSQ